MTFPKDKDLESILNEIQDQEPTLVIDFKTSSKSDILKYQLCQEFVRVLKEEKISQVQLAKSLGVDKAIVNKIIHHKINTFTVDRLMDLFSSIRSLEVFVKAS
ncbi:MAG: XRE family transcriptional regulator [Bacteriovoracaceae bacterium]|nr:XRE family transcriptional regulator [Bacteriovoracaceae bacterium]